MGEREWLVAINRACCAALQPAAFRHALYDCCVVSNGIKPLGFIRNYSEHSKYNATLTRQYHAVQQMPKALEGQVLKIL